MLLCSNPSLVRYHEAWLRSHLTSTSPSFVPPTIISPSRVRHFIFLGGSFNFSKQLITSSPVLQNNPQSLAIHNRPSESNRRSLIPVSSGAKRLLLFSEIVYRYNPLAVASH